MKLLQMCDDTPAVVAPDSTVADAVHTMLDRSVGAVAIVDSEFRVAGIFTERDVLRKITLSGRDPRDIKISEVMTRPVEMATNDTSAGEALAAMIDAHYRHLPIVDKEARLLGILSIRNLLEARVDDLTQQLDSLEQYVSNDDNIGG